jgi:electron transfer flavoprotein alpha subunit
VGLELLGIGRRLADKLGEDLVAVLLGNRIEELTDDLAAYGADKIILVEHDLLGRYTTETYTKVFAELVCKYKPSVLLIGGTLNGRELAPRLATRLSTGITADCTDFDIDKDGYLIQIKPFSKLMAKIKCRTKPQMATAKPNAFKRLKPDWSRKAIVIREEVKISPNEMKTKIIEVIKTTNSIYGNLEEADVIVAGGRGLGSKENFKLIHDLADLLGATVAGTRSVVNRGWLPVSQQVGQSGKMVTPRLYIAVGISGATYHTVGMQKSEVIVAINKDAKAPIFQIATYGIVGDLFEILPIFMDKLKKVLRRSDIKQPSEQKPSNLY